MRWRTTIAFTALLGAGVFIGMLLSAESGLSSDSPVAPATASAQVPEQPRATAPPSSSALAAAQNLSSAFQWVAEIVTPSVVTIQSVRTIQRDARRMPEGFPHEFFRRAPRDDNHSREFQSQGLGSGVIVSSDGYIVTNNHVVENADELTVLYGEDSDEVPATVVGRDPWTDIAVIRVDLDDLPAIRMGDSDDLHVGHWLLAVGSPFGDKLQHTVTSGIVSALNRSIGLIEPNRRYTGFESFIQTDAAINPGNSGGALVNLSGELVGINTAISSTSGANAGIGFAVPINMARLVMEQLIEHGRVLRGYLGVGLRPVTAEFRDALGLPNTRGAFVGNVVEGTAAARAGLQSRDVIREVDGEEIRTMPQIRNKIATSQPGQELILGVWRDERMIRVPVTLGEVPEEFREAEPERIAQAEPETATRFGMTVRTMEANEAKHLGYEGRTGVLVTQVQPRSQAAEKGIREGDLIEEVTPISIASTDEFEERLDTMEPGQAVLLLVRRGESARYEGFRITQQK